VGIARAAWLSSLLGSCDVTAKMALPERFSLLHSELNGFLFATMGTEDNGAPLSVLSGLTRLGIDPWAGGARLAKLPKEAAARALTPLIALFPKNRSESHVRELALYLAGLLPRKGTPILPAPALSAVVRKTRWPAIWLFWLGVALLLLIMTGHGSSLWP
jgi:hypothetical protein